MSVDRGFLSRPIVMFVFAALALACATTFMGQNPTPQTSRQPGAGGAAQSQPQNSNQNAQAAQASGGQFDQRGQAQPAGQQTRQFDRQANRADRANSADSRERRSDDQEESAWLGIYLSQRDNERGATIAQVYPAGPAARAGLQSGDVIQQINGQQVSSGSDLVGVLDKLHPGDKVELNVLRNDEPTKLTATLGRNSYASSNNRQSNRFSGRGGQSEEDEDLYNFPLHAMELEHNRRNAEQHQRIENEIAQLRDEIRQLRESLQRR